MIGIFLNKRGYFTVFTLIMSLLMITSVFLSINAGKYFFEQNYTETAADSIALSLATWESRGLNSIAILNYGMTRSVHYIRAVLLLWAASIGVALSGNPSLFFHLSRRAPRVIRRLWASGVQFSKMAGKIKNAVPFLMIGCYGELLKYYGIRGFLYPALPSSSGKSDTSLRLYLKDGEPLSITGILGEAKGKAGSHKPKNRFKKTLYRMLTRIFFSRIRSLFSLQGKIIPQITEKDFEKKQVVYFFGYTGVQKPFLDTIFNENYRNFAVSCAKPAGGTSYRARWNAKRIAPEPETVKKLKKEGKYDSQR